MINKIAPRVSSVTFAGKRPVAPQAASISPSAPKFGGFLEDFFGGLAGGDPFDPQGGQGGGAQPLPPPQQEQPIENPVTPRVPPNGKKSNHGFVIPPSKSVPPNPMPSGFWNPQVDIDDLAGLPDVTRESVKELIVSMNAGADSRKAFGAKPIRAFLMYGPPGTGKTKLCEAVATATGSAYRLISASSLGTQHFKGDGVKRVQQELSTIDRAARSNPNTRFIVQMDEVDSLFTDRGAQDSHDEDRSTLNQFLAEINKLPRNVVIAYTTNHLDKLDDAAIRNGRVDRKIKVNRPSTAAQRREIIELYIHKPEKVLAQNVDLDQIAEITNGFSGADIESMMNEAANKAMVRYELRKEEIRQGLAPEDSMPGLEVTQLDLLKAVETIDRERKSTDFTVMTSVQRPTTTFNDLGGLDEIIPKFRKDSERLSKLAAGEIVEDAASKKAWKPKLLVGGTGTGKTELAKAVAGEAKCNFIPANGSQFEDGIVGHGAQNVRKLFEAARENAPCIVFIDEAEGVFRKRGVGGQDGGSNERENTTRQILTEMEGLRPNDGVYVIAATNLPDAMDPAVLSRFQQISVPTPTHPMQRKQILDIHLRNVKLAPDVDVNQLAEDLQGYSGRDIKTLVDLAVDRAGDGNPVTAANISDARDVHEMGEKSAYPISEKDHRLIGIHEVVGHGVLVKAVQKRIPEVELRCVTMEPRQAKDSGMGGGGQVGGFVSWSKPDELYTKSMQGYLAHVLVAMGGRSSERVLLGEGNETVGGGSDYQQAERIVTQMLRLGMIRGFAPNSGELNRDEKQVVEMILGRAEQASEEIFHKLHEMKPDVHEQLVTNGIAAKTLRNEKDSKEADALYDNLLTPEDWQPIYEIVDKYIDGVIDTINDRARSEQAAFLAKTAQNMPKTEFKLPETPVEQVPAEAPAVAPEPVAEEPAAEEPVQQQPAAEQPKPKKDKIWGIFPRPRWARKEEPVKEEAEQPAKILA